MTMNKFIRILTLLLFAFSLSPLTALAQRDYEPRIEIIRDAEIENYLASLARPILQAAAIDPDSVKIYIINNSAINAFVAEGMNEFFYTGLLQATETPEQLAGVIAHETGHIAGGHLIRGREAMENASAQAILGMLFGAAVGIASGNSKVAMGAISGSQQIAQRNLLSFSRSQESSADSAALSYLDRAGITSRGLEEFMRKLGAQELVPQDRQSEYVQTHPLSQNRIDTISNHVSNSKYSNSKLDPKFQIMHERMKAKLMGFLQPEAALLRYTDKDQRISARYARSIALYRTGQLSRASEIIDSLIKEETENPFFHELKAQMLFENSRVSESVPFYKKAVELLPNSALLRMEYGHALLESKKPELLDKAIQNLIEANRLSPKDPDIWRFLAVAWGQKGEITKEHVYSGYASYALAEEAAARGSEKEAKQYAERALKILPKGTPYWLKAQDIKIGMDNRRSR